MSKLRRQEWHLKNEAPGNWPGRDRRPKPSKHTGGSVAILTAHMKQRMKDLGRRAGLEIRLSGASSREDLRLLEFMAINGIDTVIDVGANNGGFARLLLAAGFEGRIISFEPLPSTHAELKRQSEHHANWEVADRLALSDVNGEASFNITQGDASSSLLDPSQDFVADTPHVRVASTITVPTRRLDDLTSLDFEPARTLLKLDVQGGEAKVLGGAALSLGSIKGVLSEMSLMPLYVGQPDWVAVHAMITGHGFEIWDIWQGYRSPQTRRLMQVDGLYFRSCLT